MKIIGLKVNSGKQKKQVQMHHCHNVIFISTKIQDEFSLCTYAYLLTFVADQLDPNCSKLKQIYTFSFY